MLQFFSGNCCRKSDNIDLELDMNCYIYTITSSFRDFNYSLTAPIHPSPLIHHIMMIAGIEQFLAILENSISRYLAISMSVWRSAIQNHSRERESAISNTSNEGHLYSFRGEFKDPHFFQIECVEEKLCNITRLVNYSPSTVTYLQIVKNNLIRGGCL